jgi:hypothetical protein
VQQDYDLFDQQAVWSETLQRAEIKLVESPQRQSGGRTILRANPSEKEMRMK